MNIVHQVMIVNMDIIALKEHVIHQAKLLVIVHQMQSAHTGIIVTTMEFVMLL